MAACVTGVYNTAFTIWHNSDVLRGLTNFRFDLCLTVNKKTVLILTMC